MLSKNRMAQAALSLSFIVLTSACSGYGFDLPDYHGTTPTDPVPPPASTEGPDSEEETVPTSQVEEDTLPAAIEESRQIGLEELQRQYKVVVRRVEYLQKRFPTVRGINGMGKVDYELATKKIQEYEATSPEDMNVFVHLISTQYSEDYESRLDKLGKALRNREDLNLQY